MDPRVQITSAALGKKFQSETRLAFVLSQTSKALLQAASIRQPLEKASHQATGPTLDSIHAFQSNLAAIVGASGGFTAPPADQVTLSRVNGQVAVLYGEVWQADAEPTVAQTEAIAAAEQDAADLSVRWNVLKNSDLPALNRELHEASLPEIQLEADPHQEEAGMDEE